jgi:5-methylcytosine-specific restriction protein A
VARAVKEWVGRTDSTPCPPRVKVRVFVREAGKCHISGRVIQAGEPWDAEHKTAIINGGENRERNLFPALRDKHRAKTAADMAEKSRVADLAKSNLGVASQSGPKIKSRGFAAPKKPRRADRAQLPPKELFA